MWLKGGITAAMTNSQTQWCWCTDLWAHVIWKGDKHSACVPCGVWYPFPLLFTLLKLDFTVEHGSANCCKGHDR